MAEWTKITEWSKYYDLETKTLKIPYFFNSELVNLPPDTLEIIFPTEYCSLYLEDDHSIFNCKIKNLPNKLTHLTFGLAFNQEVGHQDCVDNDCPHNLPNSLTHLTFGEQFDQSADYLPHNLTHLTFGQNFDQSVDHLPHNLTHLTLGICFNKTVDHLPNKLTHLSLKCTLDVRLNNIPKNLTNLSFYSCYNFIDHIPEQIIKILIFFDDYDQYNYIIDNLPSHIKEIKISHANKLHFLKKIPFGCRIFDMNDNEILLNE